MADHWANSGIPVIGWRAGGSGVDRWGGIWFDEDFRDDHGCVFHQLYWSPRVYSPSDRSGWEMHLIPAGREQEETKYHLPNRFDLARRVFVPSPQQLLSDLMVFINGGDTSPRTSRTLIETASYRLDENGIIPQLEKYVSKVEQRTGVAQCCLAGMCDAEGPVLYSAIG
ncbi:hypothetical protein ABZ642_16160 [Streptomyces sp. NPDC007157]|uniref:hypothetical protein n=1 Tax=Streptomyces sp. NPDC007157 TaxID=3154681 RepID=UPI003410586A